MGRGRRVSVWWCRYLTAGELWLTLKIAKVRLLVERGRLKAKRVDDVVDLLFSIVEGLLGLLGGRVGAGVCGGVLAGVGFPARGGAGAGGRAWAPGKGAGVRTDVDGAEGDHGAVDLIDDAVDLLKVVRVRDDLVIGEDVLAAVGTVSAGVAVEGRHTAAGAWEGEGAIAPARVGVLAHLEDNHVGGLCVFLGRCGWTETDSTGRRKKRWLWGLGKKLSGGKERQRRGTAWVSAGQLLRPRWVGA